MLFACSLLYNTLNINFIRKWKCHIYLPASTTTHIHLCALSKVGPSSDNRIETVARAGSGTYIPVATHDISGRQESLQKGKEKSGGCHRNVLSETYVADTTSHEVADSSLGSTVRHNRSEISNNADANGVGVVVGGMGSHVVPASSLINLAVLTHQEVVADVSPSCNQ